MSFEDAYKFGKAAESQIAQWLRRGGWTILPVYEKIINEGKGPQLYTAQAELVAPDLLAFRERRVIWAEVKHKNAFTWYWKTGRWTTGIDRRHYRQYLCVERQSPWPVYLLFLHRGGKAKDNPTEESPAGLFGERLSVLKDKIDHEHDNFGRDGGVFWAIEALRKFAELKDLRTPAGEFADCDLPVAYRQDGNQYLLPLR